MNRYLFALLLIASTAFGYKGSWKIDDPLQLGLTTASPTTGQAIGTATPTYRIYEDASDTAFLTGSFVRRDSANTESLWRATVTLSAANGFEKGKNYAAFSQVVISAATYESLITFQIEAEVDANIVSDKLDYNIATIDADAITAGAIQASAIGASELATDSITNDEIAASAVTEIQSGLATAANVTTARDDILAVSDEFGSGGGLNAGQVAAAVWDATAADHDDAGTTGEALNNASSAGDPWSTALPGAYGTGSAGEMLNLIWQWVRSN